MSQSYPKTAARLPLSALLSAALVAFTIELDNEFERRVPHRTAKKRNNAPWLASMAMYLNCMQFVPDDGISSVNLVRRAHTRTNFHGMARWGYITVEDGTVYPTEKGRLARDAWAPLFHEIEERWSKRFGATEIGELRSRLAALMENIDRPLPDCLPILGHGLWSIDRAKGHKQSQLSVQSRTNNEQRIAPLLAQVLLAFAAAFERDSELSIALQADIVRVLRESGTLVREVPALAGVSKEAVAMGVGFLEKGGYVTIETPSRGAKTAVLTRRGIAAQRDYPERIAFVEERFRRRFGADVDAIREVLEPFVGDATRTGSRLFSGLDPYSDGWRATVQPPSVLPHFPMVLHRGGYPDGS